MDVCILRPHSAVASNSYKLSSPPFYVSFHDVVVVVGGGGVFDFRDPILIIDSRSFRSFA